MSLLEQHLPVPYDDKMNINLVEDYFVDIVNYGPTQVEILAIKELTDTPYTFSRVFQDSTYPAVFFDTPECYSCLYHLDMVNKLVELDRVCSLCNSKSTYTRPVLVPSRGTVNGYLCMDCAVPIDTFVDEKGDFTSELVAVGLDL